MSTGDVEPGFAELSSWRFLARDTRGLGVISEESQYSSSYVKPEDAPRLTPEEILLMRAYSMQQAAAKEFAKRKRERIGVR
jgi:hypothetical protein